MGKFRVEVTEKAEKDLEKHFKSGNKANIKKIEKLFIELSEHLLQGQVSLNNLNMGLMAFGREGLIKKTD